MCVWVSLFMLLPNCICQLLQPFGSEVSHIEPKPFQVQIGRQYPVSPEDLEFENVPLLAFSGVPCHCDEACNKVTDGGDPQNDFLSTEWVESFSLPVPMAALVQHLPISSSLLRAPQLRWDVQAELCIFVI
jgi:hypothetical protein